MRDCCAHQPSIKLVREEGFEPPVTHDGILLYRQARPSSSAVHAYVWCERRGSNPHAMGAGFWVRCVCQFHHARPLVPRPGLEPGCPKALDLEASASTGSATSAHDVNFVQVPWSPPRVQEN